MKQLNHTTQKGKEWIDETGIAIPFNRISTSEKLKEKLSIKMVKEALLLNELLLKFKLSIDESIRDISQSLEDEKKLPKNHKGNFTWYNFDKTIKIETSVNETIQFDASLIAAAREKLDEFIKKNVQGTDEVVRALINSAFHNSKGGLDSKKVLSLMKYRSKIKAAKFHEALDLIEQSISRPSSKKYFRVWAKDHTGQYQNIDLNFSSIS